MQIVGRGKPPRPNRIRDHVEAGSAIFSDDYYGYDGWIKNSSTKLSITPSSLARYIDEQAFRYNPRKMGDAERFSSVMKQIAGRRLSYAELTGKSDSQRGHANDQSEETGARQAQVRFGGV